MTEGPQPKLKKFRPKRRLASCFFWNRKTLCLLTSGTILVFVGLSTMLSFNPIVRYMISIKNVFKPGTEPYERWMDPNVPVYFDFYMFNWTNPEDIYKPGVKPELEEIGPYRYIATLRKANVSWNEENGTVTYQNYRFFEYDPDSPRDHSDTVNSINVPTLTAAYFARDSSFFVKNAVKFSISGDPIYVQKTVRELLFEGYYDPLISAASIFPPSTLKFIPDKFGWFYMANGTIGIDGVYNMDATPGPNFGTLVNFNYLNETKAFVDERCADIRKIPIGELYPTDRKPTTLTYFNPDMCRGLNLHFEKPVMVHGVSAYKFSSADDILDNGKFDQTKMCYCKKTGCLPYGVTPSCSVDCPLYYSLPHFHRADHSFFRGVQGLTPETDKHDMYFSVEPMTGAIVDVQTVLQFNLHLQPMPGFDTFQNVPDVLIPLFWFRQTALLPDDVYERLSLLHIMATVMDIIAICCITVGVLLVIFSLAYSAHHVSSDVSKRRNQSDNKEEVPLQTKTEQLEKQDCRETKEEPFIGR